MGSKLPHCPRSCTNGHKEQTCQRRRVLLQFTPSLNIHNHSIPPTLHPQLLAKRERKIQPAAKVQKIQPAAKVQKSERETINRTRALCWHVPVRGSCRNEVNTNHRVQAYRANVAHASAHGRRIILATMIKAYIVIHHVQDYLRST